MNIQWSKICIIITIYYSALILQGCCYCPADFPFFDYKSLEIVTNPPSSPEGIFSLTLQPKDVEYLVSNPSGSKNRWNIINAAYACSCEEDGDKGAKYSIVSINIYSDSIFDASIPEGEPLNKLFETAPTDLSGRNVFLPLDSINKDGGMFPRFLYTTDKIYLKTDAQPVSLGRPYSFEIKIIREDGSVITATTEPVVWQE